MEVGTNGFSDSVSLSFSVTQFPFSFMWRNTEEKEEEEEEFQKVFGNFCALSLFSNRRKLSGVTHAPWETCLQPHSICLQAYFALVKTKVSL